MKDRWRPFLDGPEGWEFMSQVGAAVTGREVHVHPGGTPMAARVFPHRHFSHVYLPSAWIRSGRERQLRGALAHELLHVMASDPDPLEGISWAIFLLSNALEDSRLEEQMQAGWPGLVRPVKALTREVLDFRTRQRQLAHSSDSLKLYEIGAALYLLLSRVDGNLIERTVSTMAVATARELLPIASPALAAPNTQEVVAIAQRIIEELERAAQRAAAKLGTPQAYAYVSSLRTELQQALQKTVEEVLHRLTGGARPGRWHGPWYRGMGGYPFYPMAWDWPNDKVVPLAVPPLATLVRWLISADPLIDVTRIRDRELAGRLTPSSRTLVRAATGQDRRVFQRTVQERWMVLPYVLGLADFVLLIEAHQWYDDATWTLLISTATALARLLGFCQVPFVVRAWTATRPRVEVEDPKTKRRYEKDGDEFYLHVATIKAPEASWGKKEELRLATLPRQGFNQPLEGYEKALGWGLNFPARKGRTRVVLCLGDGRYERLNVYSGALEYATSLLRRPGHRAVYVHAGDPMPFYESQYGELTKHFDGLVQAGTLHAAVMRTLRTLLTLLAR